MNSLFIERREGDRKIRRAELHRLYEKKKEEEEKRGEEKRLQEMHEMEERERERKEEKRRERGREREREAALEREKEKDKLMRTEAQHFRKVQKDCTIIFTHFEYSIDVFGMFIYREGYSSIKGCFLGKLSSDSAGEYLTSVQSIISPLLPNDLSPRGNKFHWR